ncbi:hypothetical protein COBT_002355 [Conglomerata obtusa]
MKFNKIPNWKKNNVIKPKYFLENILRKKKAVKQYSKKFNYFHDVYYVSIYLSLNRSQKSVIDIKEYMFFYRKNDDNSKYFLFSYICNLSNCDDQKEIIKHDQFSSLKYFFANLEFYLETDYSSSYLDVFSLFKFPKNILGLQIIPNNNGLMTFITYKNFKMNIRNLRNTIDAKIEVQQILCDVEAFYTLETALIEDYNIKCDLKSKEQIRHIDPSCINFFFISSSNFDQFDIEDIVLADNFYTTTIYVINIQIGNENQHYFLFYTAYVHLYDFVNYSFVMFIIKNLFDLNDSKVKTNNPFAYFYTSCFKNFSEELNINNQINKRICNLINVNYFQKHTAIEHTFYMTHIDYFECYMKFYCYLLSITTMYLDTIMAVGKKGTIIDFKTKVNIVYDYNLDPLEKVEYLFESDEAYSSFKKAIFEEDLQADLYDYFNFDNPTKTLHNFFVQQIDDKKLPIKKH